MNKFESISNFFDEKWYLERYNDVAIAVAEGKEKSGLQHFLRRGHVEERAISGFDPKYYTNSYPLVKKEIVAGRALSPFDHFLRFGQMRGYTPTHDGPRPSNAAKLENPFGGFWYDQPNALDIVKGKFEIGQISSEQSILLESFINDGFFILKDAIPQEILESAIKDFDLCFSGQLPGILLECPPVVGSRAAQPWQPDMNNYPAKALDLHYRSLAIRNLIFTKKIADLLGILFDAPAFASQTLGFLLGSAQEGHQDSAYVAYTIPRQFCATWIALEDVTIGAGELFYYPGSHRFPDFLYSNKYKSLHEAVRLERSEFPTGEVARHVASLKEKATEFGLKKEVFAAKKGMFYFGTPTLSMVEILYQGTRREERAW